MNFLNSDFGDITDGPSVDEFRKFYLSAYPQIPEALPFEKNEDETFDIDDRVHGRAGPLLTVFWNTITLSKRTALNYSRNLLAYGVRAGMYGGMF